MIVTAQCFFNELDLLEIKCRELEGVVDAHVVLEASRTYTGNPKPLHFHENRARFERWPIIHVVADLPSPAEMASPWDREHVQRTALFRAVQNINPEIALWLDSDELPRSDVVERFRASGHKCMTVHQDQLLYYFDRHDPTLRWRNVNIHYFDKAAPHNPWRGETHHPIMEDGGWHFEYFGARDHLVAKLDAISHAPEPGCIVHRNRVADGERPGIERTVAYPFEKLPITVQANAGFYGHYFQAPPPSPFARPADWDKTMNQRVYFGGTTS